MTLLSSITYFRTLMNELGHSEWKDPFNFSNIPGNLINRAYHIQPGPATSTVQNQTLLDLNQFVTVRLFLKGFAKPEVVRDTANSYATDILQEAQKPSRKLTSTSVGDVNSGTFVLEPLALDNDNAMIVNMSFNCRLFIDPS